MDVCVGGGGEEDCIWISHSGGNFSRTGQIGYSPIVPALTGGRPHASHGGA